jgi:hypothetical protein
MSNDTNFKLTFSCPTREQLEHVLTYLQFKKERWDFWQSRNESSGQLMQRIGAKDPAAVVSWGFNLEGDISVDDEGCASIDATAWANQNGRNVWISGEEGELADLVRRFSFLEISGELEDEYNNEESISLSGCDYQD